MRGVEFRGPGAGGGVGAGTMACFAIRTKRFSLGFRALDAMLALVVAAALLAAPTLSLSASAGQYLYLPNLFLLRFGFCTVQPRPLYSHVLFNQNDTAKPKQYVVFPKYTLFSVQYLNYNHYFLA